MISAMQSKWLTKRILIGKTDLDTAYFRIHANAKTASTCVAIVDELAFLCLRLPFGTTPAPLSYTTFSEAAIDQAKIYFKMNPETQMILTRHTDPYSHRKRSSSPQAIL